MRIRRGGDELGLAFVRVGVDRLESSLKPLRGGGGAWPEEGECREGGRVGISQAWGPLRWDRELRRWCQTTLGVRRNGNGSDRLSPQLREICGGNRAANDDPGEGLEGMVIPTSRPALAGGTVRFRRGQEDDGEKNPRSRFSRVLYTLKCQEW